MEGYGKVIDIINIVHSNTKPIIQFIYQMSHDAWQPKGQPQRPPSQTNNQGPPPQQGPPQNYHPPQGQPQVAPQKSFKV